MRIRRGALQEIVMPLHRPLETAHGPISERRGWLIELEDELGHLGFGEATPLPDFGTEAGSACRRVLEAGLTELVKTSAPLSQGDPRQSIITFMDALREREFAPNAASGLEAALFELLAKNAGRSLAAEIRDYAGLPGPAAESVATQALVGGGDAEAVSESAQAAQAEGFVAFKLKLAVHSGAKDLAQDLDRVAALREGVGPKARLRLDANEAWTLAESLEALARLERFDIDYVEQPVSRIDHPGLKRLSKESPVSVAADESLLGAGLSTCLETQSTKILIVKPAALGGVGPAFALSKHAEAAGLRLIWSTLIDGAVGRGLALALAAGLGPSREVHGLGTARLLASDLSTETEGDARLEGGRLFCSREPGLGFRPKPPADPTRGGSAPPFCFEVRS